MYASCAVRQHFAISLFIRKCYPDRFLLLAFILSIFPLCCLLLRQLQSAIVKYETRALCIEYMNEIRLNLFFIDIADGTSNSIFIIYYLCSNWLKRIGISMALSNTHFLFVICDSDVVKSEKCSAIKFNFMDMGIAIARSQHWMDRKATRHSNNQFFLVSVFIIRNTVLQ